MFCSLQLPLRSTPTAQISCLWQHRSCSLNSPSSLPYRPRHSSKFPFTSQFTKVFSNVIVCLSSGTDGSVSDCSGSLKEFEVELELLLALLPERMRRRVSQHPEFQHLIEIVMDLGRIPLARFPSGDFVLSGQPVTFQDLHHATAQVGDFADDNRAGISQTLHRISAIRNRKGVIVGLTCRVGRALSGSANMVRDLVEDGGSLLLIGPPGVGKTTIIREVARMLADDYKKRVMIVDTSNEIGGDGDIPHAGIGDARRMQVPSADMQHKVLIEAVENHMPQVIVIDEIGTKLEAMAASTIAQRGIQLVATAHGVTIENVVMNPLLEMLIGGIQSVTLGDEEASRRGVQKTVLERKGPATFTCGVEIISKNELRVHRSLEATVDCLLSGRSPSFEVRKVTSQGFTYQKLTIAREPLDDISYQNQDEIIVKYLSSDDERGGSNESFSGFAANIPQDSYKDGKLHLYFYGILETSLKQAIKQLGMDDAIELTDNISEAHALLALHSKLKKNAGIQAVSKSRDIPIYVTKTTSLGQIMKALHSITSEESRGFKDKNKFLTEGEDKRNSSEKIDALEEARLAIERVVIAKGKAVELLPRPPEIIALQTDLVKDYRLDWEKVGKQPDLRLRILPLCSGTGERYEETVSTGRKDEDSSDDMNVFGSSLTRLPLLSD